MAPRRSNELCSQYKMRSSVIKWMKEESERQGVVEQADVHP